jgi:hypothetical protein
MHQPIYPTRRDVDPSARLALPPRPRTLSTDVELWQPRPVAPLRPAPVAKWPARIPAERPARVRRGDRQLAAVVTVFGVSFALAGVAGVLLGASEAGAEFLRRVALVLAGLGALAVLAGLAVKLRGGGHHCPGCPHH